MGHFLVLLCVVGLVLVDGNNHTKNNGGKDKEKPPVKPAPPRVVPSSSARAGSVMTDDQPPLPGGGTVTTTASSRGTTTTTTTTSVTMADTVTTETASGSKATSGRGRSGSKPIAKPAVIGGGDVGFSNDFKKKVEEWKKHFNDPLQRPFLLYVLVEKIEPGNNGVLMMRVDPVTVLSGECSLLVSKDLVMAQDFPGAKQVLDMTQATAFPSLANKKTTARGLFYFIEVVRGANEMFTVKSMYSDYGEMFMSALAQQKSIAFPMCVAQLKDKSSFGSRVVINKADAVFQKVAAHVASQQANAKAGVLKHIHDRIKKGPDYVQLLYDQMRRSDVTINFDPKNLELFVQSGRCKNAFEIRKTYPRAGNTYGHFCEWIYKGFDLPIPVKGSPTFDFDIELQPKFMGLNVGRSLRGAAPAYGQGVFVMRDEVKQYLIALPADSSFTYVGSETALANDPDAQRKLKLLRDGLGLFTDNGLWTTLLSKLLILDHYYLDAKTSMETTPQHMIQNSFHQRNVDTILFRNTLGWYLGQPSENDETVPRERSKRARENL